MRYGDKADNFYITLSGLVSIIIPIKIPTLLNLNEYNRYIALLLLYKEFELVRLSIKDNKSEFSLDIPDLKFIFQYLNKNKEEKIKIRKKKKKIMASDFSKYSKHSQLAMKRYSMHIEEEETIQYFIDEINSKKYSLKKGKKSKKSKIEKTKKKTKKTKI